MNKRVVSLDKAEQCLLGHEKYIPHLRQEYTHPKAFGSLNEVIEETDGMSADDSVFDRNICQFLNECESTQMRFVLLAMLGIEPDGTNWG